jgi:tetratricopeptide (TPR) repeat protein
MKHWLLRLALTAGILAAGMYWRSWFGYGPAPKKPAFDLPPLSKSPYQNTSLAVGYVGITVCKECHAEQHNTWRQTAHSLALADVHLATEPADASLLHAASGRAYSICRKDGRLRHSETVRDHEGKELATADYPLRYLVGSGRHTRSYLIEVDGFLAESPLTWYASKRAWGMSPGYDRPNHRGFERAADGACLFCHVGRITAPERDYQRLTFAEQPIGCERCHGPGALHVAEERKRAKAPRPADAAPQTTIVNPSRLSRSLQEAICAACHLNIDAVVLVRGRRLTDFRPGLPLSDFCVNYRLDEPDSQMKVVGHVDQLHLSRCYKGSDKLTCITCHDPHTVPTAEARQKAYIDVCKNCHADGNCRLPKAERLRKSPSNDCVACHMPQVGTDIPHIAFTHHRIGIHDAAAGRPAPRPDRLPELVAFDDESRFSPLDQKRNLGMAYFGLSQRQTSMEAAEAYRDRAWRLLDSVRSRGLPDAEVTASLALLRRGNDPKAALGLAGEALAAEGLSPKMRINCLFLSAEVGLQLNRLEVARRALERLVKERRLSQDWLLLGTCRQRQGDLAGALPALEQAVAIAPFRPDLRNALAEAQERLGRVEAAREQRAIATRLASQAAPKR